MHDAVPPSSSSANRVRRSRNAPFLPVIGWKEFVALPEWGIWRLKAKIDTGARSCALHAHILERMPPENPGEAERLRLALSLSRHDPERVVCIEVPVTCYKSVRNTGGIVEVRPFVRTRIRLGDKEFETEMGIADRERMLFRIILGRKFLEGRFGVDVSAKYLQSRNPGGKRK
jgi:hypothetical protein